jgi:O-antigen/teichoic acid export membrane protein
MSYTKKAVLGLGILFACQVATSLLSYVLRLILARALTPVEYGLLYAVLAFFGFFGFAQTLGLSDAIVQRMPRFKSTGEVKSAFITVVYSLLILTGIIAITLSLLAPWLARSYFNNSLAVPLVVICALFFFISPAEAMLLAIFQGMGKLHWYGLLLFARTAALVIVTVVFLHFGFGVLAPALGYLLMYVVVPLLYLPLLLRAYPDFGAAKARYDLRLLRELLAFGLPVMLTGIIGFFLGNIDTFFITLYRPLSDVALYNVAFPTASLSWFISGVIYAGMLPIVSEMGAAKAAGLLSEGVGKMYLYLLIAILPFTAVILLFPDIIINALFGSRYVAAALTLQFLVIGGIFYVFAILNTSIITGLGRPKKVFIAMLAAAALNTVLDILLIPRFGIEGSAVATLSAFVLFFVMSMRALRKLVEPKLLYGRMLLTLVATLIFGAALVLLRNALPFSFWWKAIVALIIGAVLYLVLLFALRIISIRELRELRDMVLRK